MKHRSFQSQCSHLLKPIQELSVELSPSPAMQGFPGARPETGDTLPRSPLSAPCCLFSPASARCARPSSKQNALFLPLSLHERVAPPNSQLEIIVIRHSKPRFLYTYLQDLAFLSDIIVLRVTLPVFSPSLKAPEKPNPASSLRFSHKTSSAIKILHKCVE